MDRADHDAGPELDQVQNRQTQERQTQSRELDDRSACLHGPPASRAAPVTMQNPPHKHADGQDGGDRAAVGLDVPVLYLRIPPIVTPLGRLFPLENV
jgi:hypothetical protein